MAEACPGRPPPAMTEAELEAAIAALPAKKDALREAYDRLAASTPAPLPFAWEDLDAHISSLHSSFSLRFRQLRVLAAARPSPAVSPQGETLGSGKAKNQDEDKEKEEEQAIVEEEEREGKILEEEAYQEMSKKNNEEVVEVEEGDGEMQDAGYEMCWKNNKKVEGEEEPQEVDDGAYEEMLEADAYEEMLGADDELGNKSEEEIIEDSDKIGKKTQCETEMDADEEMLVADEEILVANEEILVAGEEPDAKYAKNASNEAKEEETSKEGHDFNKENDLTKKVSVPQNKAYEVVCEDEEVQQGHEAEEEQDADEEKHNANDAKQYQIQNKEGVQAGGMKVSQELANRAPPGDGKAACASMNTRWLVNSVCNCIILGKELPVRIRCHPDSPALTLRIVKLFLRSNKPKTNKSWEKCVMLLRSVTEAAAKPSADTMEQAKQVAKDWKEMIENPGSNMVLGNLASWGLLYFLISYNIVSEFGIDEIIRLFGTVPHNKQTKNTVELLKGLGLADRITDLIDYLIGNGQQLDGIHLVHVFNLVDKYPPLSILKGYVEKAKQTAREIFQNNVTHKSQDAVIEKEVNNLRSAHNVVKKHITDSSQCSSIVSEIVNLLYEYGKKKRSSANSSTASTSNSQPKKQSNEKRKKAELEQEHHDRQEEQQGQLSQPGKLAQKQNKAQQKQQKQGKQQEEGTDKQEKKPQETQQERPKRPRRRTQAPWVPYMARIGQYGHTRYAAVHGVHGHPAQQYWPEVHRVPFGSHLGGPQYIEPFYPVYPHPQFYPR